MANYPEIRDLQLLLALAQRKHFTQAAADCGISQPAFSARIRHLEDELGVPIVRRGNKFMGFTSDGELILKWASKIVSQAEGLRQDIDVVKGNLMGSLVLGVVPTALSYAALLSTRLREVHPQLTIQVTSMTSAQIIRRLADFSLDAGLTYEDDIDLPHVQFQAIYEEQYILFCPADLAPCDTGPVSWADASRLPLCLLSKDMHFREIVDNAFMQAGVTAQPVMETNAFTAAIAKVAHGSAATIAPSALVDSFMLDERTIKLPLINPEASYTIGLAVLDHEPVLPAITALESVIDK
ncbi:MAG: LysR family transcriptional regulator [Granulosicoccus sp.]